MTAEDRQNVEQFYDDDLKKEREAPDSSGKNCKIPMNRAMQKWSIPPLPCRLFLISVKATNDGKRHTA